MTIGLLRIPLPQADYHELRHNHASGEICEHHDHLLRWHPGVGRHESVAVLHWHWFLPTADQPDDDDEHGQGSRLPVTPAMHADADGLEPEWPDGLAIQADSRGRSAHPGVTLGGFATLVLCGIDSQLPEARGPSASLCRPSSSHHLHLPLVRLFQQQNC